MNTPLHATTVQALNAFRARRRRLLGLRAVLCLGIILMGTWMLIALLDRAWFMPEGLRPWLSVMGYAGALFLAWQVAWRHVGAARDEAETARLIEAAAPELRESLLAAVELGQGKERGDSAEFRAQLQERVAESVSRLDLTKLLPMRSLKPWLLGLSGMIAVVVALSFVPSLHLPGFMVRAAVPFANLSRPSSVKIAITQPQPANALVPFASELEVVAEVIGLVTGPVLIETQSAVSKPRRTEMVSSLSTRYSSVVAIGQGDVRYRVLAGDAISPWHTLSARARPRVIEFVKTIVPPAYSGLPEQQVTEEQGDLEALEGSKVRLTLKTNQPVSQADLLLNPDHADHPEAVPARVNADGTLAGEVLVKNEHESWRAALTSKETGFTNEESSPWRILSIADLPPVAQVLEPQEQLALMADEVVRIEGVASDDVGLAQVKLAHAINGADWQEREIAQKPGKEANVKPTLPLAPLQVKAGDAVLVKLIAIDLKGQRAESPAVRLIILEQTVDPQLRLWAEQSRRLAQQAVNLAEETRELQRSVEQVKRADPKKPQEAADTALARAQTELQQVSDRADDLWEKLKEAAQSAPTHLDAMETQLLGEKLAHLRHEGIAPLKKHIENPSDQGDMMRRKAGVTHADANDIAQAARAFATEDNAKITAQATQQLSRQAALLTEQSLAANRDAAQRPKWQEQQRASLAATEALKQELESLKPILEGGQQRQIEDMNKQLTETANDLAASLDKPEQTKSPEHLYGASDNHRQRLSRAAEALRGIAENAAQRSNQQREHLARQENPAITALNESKDALSNALNEARKPGKEKLDKENLTAMQRAEKLLKDAAQQLEDQAVLREQNALTNTEAALDTNRASRAAEKLATEVKRLPKEVEAVTAVQKKAEQLTQAARALELDALAQTAMQASAEAAANVDPTKAANPTQPSDQARAASEALRQLPQMLQRLKNPDPQLANVANQAADTSRQASEQLQALARQSAQTPTQPLNLQAAEQFTRDAEQKAAQVAEQVATQTATAREALAQLTPQVSDMMKAVAQEVKQTQQETQAAAAQAEANQPVTEVAEKAQDLQTVAAANADKMESLQAALRQEANAANLQEADQRQMSRTADVALAQMQQKAPQIAQNLKQAAQAKQSQPQAQNLNQAAAAQQQTAQSLEQLAENMAKMEQGEALTEQELAAMQKMEQELGVQEPLDEAYARAQALAEMAQDATQNPAAVLAELEKELPKNASMQKALAEISKQTAQASEQAVTAEAQQPSNIGLAAEKAANDLARVARHQDRLGQKEAAQQTAQASQQLLAAKAQPGQPAKPTTAESQTAATQAAKAAETAAAATPPATTMNPFQQIQGALLAQALDQLDATLHPAQGQQAQQDGQQQQQQQGQGKPSSAQQSLAQAQQSQQQSMADQRNQGQAPGSQQSSQQQAQNNTQPNANDPTQPSSTEGGNQSMKIVDGVLGGELILATGDWGHLPSKMAEDLSEATRTEAAPEYRAAIESYYKAIATKAKR